MDIRSRNMHESHQLMTREQMCCMLNHFNKHFSNLMKKLFILHCDERFILFVSEILSNILAGNLPIAHKTELVKFQREIRILTTTQRSQSMVKQLRDILGTPRGLNLLRIINVPMQKHFNCARARVDK